jgi:hypothetical protein
VKPVPASHEQEIDVVVLIKAAPEIGRKHGETVCVAGIDLQGGWHRLYPVAFRDLNKTQRFGRWDIVRVRWRKPVDDDRAESKRIDPVSLKVVGQVKERERPGLIERALVTSIDAELVAGRSLALIRPHNVEFKTPRLTSAELTKSERRRAELLAQGDLLATSLIPEKSPPVAFRFSFDHDGKRRTHTCIDWETEWTFFKWREKYGEDSALQRMRVRWGEELPAKGLVFALGTHRVKMFKKWLLSGLIQVSEQNQGSLL